MLTLGDAAELSPNASVMLRIATLSAWAELEVASTHQVYLVEVVKPYRASLAPLWVSSLRDYASIRIDAEALDDTPAGALDSSYSSLGREVLLPVRRFLRRPLQFAQSLLVLREGMASHLECSGDCHAERRSHHSCCYGWAGCTPNSARSQSAARNSGRAYRVLLCGVWAGLRGFGYIDI